MYFGEQQNKPLVHTSYSNIGEAEVGGIIVNLRLVWATKRIQGSLDCIVSSKPMWVT